LCRSNATLLDITGQPIPDWCEGQILPFIQGDSHQPNRSVFVVEAKNNAKQGSLQKATIAHIKGDHKLVYYFGYDLSDDFIELFDIKNDPDELNEISSSHSGIEMELKAELKEKLRKINADFLS